MRAIVATASMALMTPSEASAAAIGAPPGIESAPLYDSVEDPPGQQPKRILAEDGVLHFGQAGEERTSLLASDLGFVMYFLRVDGGVRVRGQPIIFPDSARKHLDFEDFSCSVAPSDSATEVLCRSKADSRLYHSRIVDGGLVNFEIRCFDRLDEVCHYKLVGGHPIRPSKIQDN